MYVGGDDVVEAYTQRWGVVRSSKSTRASVDPITVQPLPPCTPGVQVACFVGFRRPSVAIVNWQAQTHSPVDLVVTDPDGITITPQTAIVTQRELLREVPGALYYSDSGLDGNGTPDVRITAPVLKTGDYLVRVMPRPGALLFDTYGLEVEPT